MCLIFIKPKTAKNYLTHERFMNALTNNPHAVGIVYRAEAGIKIERFVKPEANKEEIWNIIKDKEEFAIHFRYATHGILNLTNTHPFIVTKGLCMMHNGVMSEFGDLNKDWSDTKNFVEYFLKPYIEQEGIDVVHSADFKTDLEKVIGNGNKLLFIDKDFNFSIINEKQGVWKEGCWLSNTYSVEPPYSSYYNTYAPKDGTAATSTTSTKSYDWSKDYNYGYSDYDYGYGDNKYLQGSMTRDEVNEFIGKEISNGFLDGYDIPYTLDIDEKKVAELGENDVYKQIGDQIKQGVYKGTLPCPWELLISEEDIKPFLINEDDYYYNGYDYDYNKTKKSSNTITKEQFEIISKDMLNRKIIPYATTDDYGQIYNYLNVSGKEISYEIDIKGAKTYTGNVEELKKSISEQIKQGKSKGKEPLSWTLKCNEEEESWYAV